MSITQKILESKKYKALFPKTVERIVDSFPLELGEKVIEEKTRSMLHQIWGSYYSFRPDFNKLWKKVQKNEITIPELLNLHASTKERVEIINKFYSTIFDYTGKIDSIVDYGCGFNPLFISHIPYNLKYTALDIDLEELAFLNNAVPHYLGDFIAEKGISFEAKAGDILSDEVYQPDLVFMFKLLQVLEHQSPGISETIIEKQKAKYIAVSFPTRSIGGKNKGMKEYYSSWFRPIAEKYKYIEVEFETELLFVITK